MQKAPRARSNEHVKKGEQNSISSTGRYEMLSFSKT